MIIFGKAIRRSTLTKIKIIILIIVIGLFALSCSKVEFDPKTSTLKYLFKKKNQD